MAGPRAEAILRILKTLNVTLVIEHLKHPVKEIFGDQPEAARDRSMRETLQAAYAKLGQMEGPDPSNWAWGRIHTVVFHHPLESIPEMKPLVDLGPIARGTTAPSMPRASARATTIFIKLAARPGGRFWMWAIGTTP